jgi:hypothetical protein
VSNSEKRRKHPIYPLVYEHKNMLVWPNVDLNIQYIRSSSIQSNGTLPHDYCDLQMFSLLNQIDPSNVSTSQELARGRKTCEVQAHGLGVVWRCNPPHRNEQWVISPCEAWNSEKSSTKKV